jgi:GTP cyclohydrolase II
MMPDPLEALFSWLDRAPQPPTRPSVTVSYAQSLDGSIAAPGGVRLRLSGPQSMRMTHRLRAVHDAIMVGIGTVLADDPQLTVREIDGPNPRPIIVDAFLRTPPHARVLQAGTRPLIAAGERFDETAASALLAAGAEIHRFPTCAEGLICMSELVSMLGALGVRRVMVEGGTRLITSFLNARLADRVVITICPCLVGGQRATEAIAPNSSGDFPRLVNSHSTMAGEDIVVWGQLDYGAP